MSEPRPIVFDKDLPEEPTNDRLLSLFRHENAWLRSRVAELEKDLKGLQSSKSDEGWKAALAEIARLEGELAEATAVPDVEPVEVPAPPPGADQAVKDVKYVVRRFQKSPIRIVLRRRSGWRELEDRWGRPSGQGGA